MFCRISYHGYIAATPEPWTPGPSFQVPALPEYMSRSHIVYTILLTDFNLFCLAIHIHVSQYVCFVLNMLTCHTQQIPHTILNRCLGKSGTSLGLSCVLPKTFPPAISGGMPNNGLSTHSFLWTCRKVSGVDPRSFAEQWTYRSSCPAFGFSPSFN